MQIVIDISEEYYKRVSTIVDMGLGTNVDEAIKNGKPLPKGHGRLIDESKITKCEQIGLIIKDNNVIRCITTDASTIIEADKE